MKQVLVTGASRGIGASIARALGASGDRIWLHYRAEGEKARAVALDIQTSGGPEPLLVPFDLADRQAVGEAVRGLLDTHGVPDALILNAGVSADGLFALLDDASWDKVVAGYVTGQVIGVNGGLWM